MSVWEQMKCLLFGLECPTRYDQTQDRRILEMDDRIARAEAERAEWRRYRRTGNFTEDMIRGVYDPREEPR
jgi:hypothetical protein